MKQDVKIVGRQDNGLYFLEYMAYCLSFYISIRGIYTCGEK